TAPLQADVHLNFLLRARETEIKSLKLATRNSRLEASGTLRNYNNPEVTLQYQATLDLAEVAKEAKLAQLRAGSAEVKGTGNYQGKHYSTEGSMKVRDLEWHDATVRVAGVDAASPYSVTEEKIVLSRLIANAFGGAVQGDAQITNWNPANLSPAPAGKK